MSEPTPDELATWLGLPRDRIYVNYPGDPCRRHDCQNRIDVTVNDPALGTIGVCLDCWRAACDQIRPMCAHTTTRKGVTVPACKRTTLTRGTWCSRCVGNVHQAATAALGRWEQLTNLRSLDPNNTSGDGTRVRGTRTPLLPMKTAPWLLGDTMHDLYLKAKDQISGGRTTVDRVHAHRQVGAAAIWIGLHVDQLLATDYGRSLADEILTVEWQAVRVLGLNDPEPQRREAPCPGCDTKALFRIPGENASACDVCHRVVPDDEYDTWAKRQIIWAKSVKAEEVAAAEKETA